MSYVWIIHASTCSSVNSYLDIFIGQYSTESLLTELAHCLSLFPNLHTVQIDVSAYSRLREIYEQTFEKYSYPQICNVFIMIYSMAFVASCPRARCVGWTRHNSMISLCLLIIRDNFPHLEILKSFGVVFGTPDACI